MEKTEIFEKDKQISYISDLLISSINNVDNLLFSSDLYLPDTLL